MELFDNLTDKTQNLLPKDGTVNYHSKVLSNAKSNDYLEKLLTQIEWKNDEAIIFEKKIITKRKVAWYGDTSFEYTYSNITKRALPWSQELLELKALVEKETSKTYNSCLLNLYHSGDEGYNWLLGGTDPEVLNLYHSGDEGMAWHSDGETDLKTLRLRSG